MFSNIIYLILLLHLPPLTPLHHHSPQLFLLTYVSFFLFPIYSLLSKTNQVSIPPPAQTIILQSYKTLTIHKNLLSNQIHLLSIIIFPVLN